MLQKHFLKNGAFCKKFLENHFANFQVNAQESNTLYKGTLYSGANFSGNKGAVIRCIDCTLWVHLNLTLQEEKFQQLLGEKIVSQLQIFGEIRHIQQFLRKKLYYNFKQKETWETNGKMLYRNKKQLYLFFKFGLNKNCTNHNDEPDAHNRQLKYKVDRIRIKQQPQNQLKLLFLTAETKKQIQLIKYTFQQ
eukprot:TRINITY_DN25872_c1_g1_i2.p1 TRINITY_DN25872_c1_g1~~TRINITY_DN25872_c1_g1_i2.p1  ORF type:complete len:192 (+),score=12.14 TRINITY_DN25872_c1_g1_i2:89-664(+)